MNIKYSKQRYELWEDFEAWCESREVELKESGKFELEPFCGMLFEWLQSHSLYPGINPSSVSAKSIVYYIKVLHKKEGFVSTVPTCSHSFPTMKTALESLLFSCLDYLIMLKHPK